MNRAIKDRVAADRYIFAEHPAESESWMQDEMKDVQSLIADGSLYFIRADGCALGYVDRESGKPYRKPMGFVTNMPVAVNTLSHYKCPGCSEHERLCSNNCFGPRTTQVAEWPEFLDRLFLAILDQQMAVDSAFETYAAEPDGPARRVRRRVGPHHLAPQPAPALHQVPGEGRAPADDLPREGDQPGEEEDERLPPEERDRRREWRQLPADVRHELMKFHVSMGHLSHVGMMRLLRRAGARPDVIKAVPLLNCQACGDRLRAKQPRPVRHADCTTFNHKISVDTVTVHDVDGYPYHFLNIVCEATGFQVMAYLNAGTGVPSASLMVRSFATSWSSWAGLPSELFCDRGKENQGAFANYLRSHDVEITQAALESPWQNGRCERAGGLWKELFSACVVDCHIQGENDVIMTAAICTQVRNELERIGGYSPNQWVLGAFGPRVPGSLLADGVRDRMEIQEAAADPQSQMARSLARREAARVAFMRADNSARLRRALLRNTRPDPGPYPVGAAVYYRRAQVRRGENPLLRWYGAARVIGHEGRGHGVWLRHGTSIILASPQQLRFAHEDELLATKLLSADALQPRRGRQEYLDIRAELAPVLGHGQVPGEGHPPPDGQGPSDVPQPPADHGGPDIVRPPEDLPPPEGVASPAPQPRPAEVEPQAERVRDEDEPVPEPLVPLAPAEVPVPDDGRDQDLEVPLAAAEVPVPDHGRDQDLEEPRSNAVSREVPPRTLLDRVLRDPDRLDGLRRLPRERPGPYDRPPEESLIVDAYLTGNLRKTKEIDFRKLAPTVKRLYEASMQKEWKSWLLFDAVEVINQQDIPDGTKVVGTRWVHTDKNASLRAAGQDVPILAKSRLVVQGHQESAPFRCDAPTASLLSFNLLCSYAVSRRWSLRTGDASNAYLQSDGVTRLLVLRVPDPVPDPSLVGKYLRAKGAIYGTKDAGRGWWLKLKAELLSLGWRLHPLEPAFFVLYNDQGSVTGLLLSHVDDLLFAGEGDYFENTITQLSERIQLSFKDHDFTFCGKKTEQDDQFSVHVSQKAAADALEFILVDRVRRKNLEAPLRDEEKQELRRAIGSLGWLARQSRPDLLASVSLLAQSLGTPVVGHLVQANRVIKACKETSERGLHFLADSVKYDPQVSSLFCCSDASFANGDDEQYGERTRSQLGFIVGIRSSNDRFHALEYVSSKIRRVCRSTMSAECNALLEGAESAEYVNQVLRLMDDPGFETDKFADPYYAIDWLVDAKCLQDVVSRDTSIASDKRLRILIAQLREMIDTSCGRLRCLWVDTKLLLADALTKAEAERGYMMKCLEENLWSTTPTSETLLLKENIRRGRQARHARRCL